MKKIDVSDASLQPDNPVSNNIRRLQDIFPEAFSEGKIDFEVLKQLLGGEVDDSHERFGLNWHGKKRARQIALTPSNGTLRPCPEDSVDWDTTQNLMIEGDNLEVLKLLQKSYAGKVKMIYIDPPYNTGKDFVYPDNFQDNIANYKAITGQTDEEGLRVSTNTETSGRYHTDWLNMMYPRLKLARNLLRDDGALFVTLDDTEVANMRCVCDEIFGEENFLANVVWQKKYAVANDDPGIGVMHDHVLVYRKSGDFIRGLLPRTQEQNNRYSNPDNDPRGEWASDNYVSNKSKDERPTLWYSIIHPKTGEKVWPEKHAVWRYSQEKHLKIESEGRLYWGPDLSYKKPRLKRYLKEIQQGIVPPTWWVFGECGHNDEAQKETSALLGRKVFSTPKPLRLIQRMLTIAAPEKSIVLDFFAGSGSTAHAVLSKNCSDQGERSYIVVQLPEPLSLGNSDQKNASLFCEQINKPKNIAELTKERLRRAGQKIKADHPDWNGDTGFRVFKLDSSNIRPWQADRDNLALKLDEHISPVIDGRTEADLETELMLRRGVMLSESLQTRDVAGLQLRCAGDGILFSCLAPHIPESAVELLAEAIVSWHTELNADKDSACYFLDSAFENNVTKANLSALLKQHGLSNVFSL